MEKFGKHPSGWWQGHRTRQVTGYHEAQLIGDRQEIDRVGKPTLKMTRAGQVRRPDLVYWP